MTDVNRLREVLALCKEQGLTPSFVVVGDIRLQLAGVQAKEEKKAPLSKDDEEAEALRRKGRALFGRDFPLDQLKEMKGAI